MKWQRIPRWLMSLAIGWILALNLGAAVLPEPQEGGQIPSVLAENALTNDPESSRPASTENYVASGPLAQEMVAAHMKMTQADKDLEIRLQDRQKQGEYILESEFPSQRMFHEVALNSLVQLSPEKSAELDQLFASLGLPPETRQQLQNHAMKIRRADGDAEFAIMQLLQAQYAYDKKMRSLLSATNYAKYRQYEGAKRALCEYEHMQNYAEESDFKLEAGYKSRLVEIIQQVNAYTIETSGGPYDGVPTPIAGAEPVIEHAKGQISDLKRQLPRIDKKAAELRLPEAYRKFLKDYYTHKIQSLQNVCKQMDPAYLRARMEEEHRRMEMLLKSHHR